MRVGVIIPAFNVAPWLAQAVLSVLNQTHRDWSLTVVDDGSTDATADIIARFTDPRITAIRQANQGVSAARNRGIAATAADTLLFLDGDDWLAPHALATLSAALGDAPSAVAAAGDYVRVGTDGACRRVHVRAGGDVLRRVLVQNPFINGGHLLIRRPALDAAGPFDTGLSYGEDWHLWARLAAQGPFVTVRGGQPLLFLRERPGSAYHTMAHDPGRFRPCLDAIYQDARIRARFPANTLAALRQQAEAENNWVIGRELIRHGYNAEGRASLTRSFRAGPSVKRLGLLGLSWLGVGPFRSYGNGPEA
jgi:glycosyltransferase involved in cell wall biosynthesis